MPTVVPVLAAAFALTLVGCTDDEVRGPPASAPVVAEPEEGGRVTRRFVARAASPRVAARARAVRRTREAPCRPAAFRQFDAHRHAHAAIVRDRAWAFEQPGRGRITQFDDQNVNGVPMVFGVLGRSPTDCRGRWYRVQLPLRPNGRAAYVRARDVTVEAVTTRVVVSLSRRQVTVFDSAKKVLETRAAIGAPATPTPVGRFYVNQRLRARDASGPYGPGALGISAFSPVLTSWTQGGPIAIHGTNQPELLGLAVSNGCIRVRNDVIERLFRFVYAGTPVVIEA